MKLSEKLELQVQEALDTILEDALHPERFDVEGNRLPKNYQIFNRHPAPALPEYARISVQLDMYLAVAKWRLSLVKAAKGDTEALAAYHRHKTQQEKK